MALAWRPVEYRVARLCESQGTWCGESVNDSSSPAAACVMIEGTNLYINVSLSDCLYHHHPGHGVCVAHTTHGCVVEHQLVAYRRSTLAVRTRMSRWLVEPYIDYMAWSHCIVLSQIIRIFLPFRLPIVNRSVSIMLDCDLSFAQTVQTKQSTESIDRTDKCCAIRLYTRVMEHWALHV